MEEEKKYKIETTCNNCGQKIVLWIPMGLSVKNWKITHKCDYCGCLLKD